MKRLVIFIVIFAIFLAFIVFNLENKSDVSLGFHNFEEVPVFLSVLFAFILGMLFAIPLMFSLSRRRNKDFPPHEVIKGQDKDIYKKDSGSYGID